MIKKTQLVVLITIFSVIFFSGMQGLAQQQGGYTDEFTSNTINSIWSNQIDYGLSIGQTSGVLTSAETSLGGTDLGASLYKTIDSNTEKVAVDYSFNSLNGMGRIYLIGKDSTGTKVRWVIGLSDGWAARNAKPLIYIYDSDGVTPNPQTSWNFADSTSIYLTNSESTGHIEVSFITSTMIDVSFTFSVASDGSTATTGTFDLSGSTGRVYLSFNYPPSQYYENGECFMFDNYAENGLTVPSTMSRNCPNSAVNQTFTNGIVGTNTATSNPTDGIWLILFLIGAMVVIVSITTVILNKKSNQTSTYNYKMGDVNSNNGVGLVRNSSRSLFCGNCHESFLPEDRFCSRCGNLLRP